MAAHGARQVEDGWTLGYDPRIADGLEDVVENADMWGIWDIISCPALALSGKTLDFLLLETATEMTVRRPKADLVVIP